MLTSFLIQTGKTREKASGEEYLLVYTSMKKKPQIRSLLRGLDVKPRQKQIGSPDWIEEAEVEAEAAAKKANKKDGYGQLSLPHPKPLKTK
ncbi:hypothetical protein SLA2020_030600 [Shorea laevis]